MEVALFKMPVDGQWTRERVTVASFMDMNKLAADCPVYITILSVDGQSAACPADEDSLLYTAVMRYIAEANGDTTLLDIAEMLFDMAVTPDG